MCIRDRTKCRCCGIVKTVCFWGELTKYKSWKRTFLFVASLPLAVGMCVLLIISFGNSKAWGLWLFGVPLLIFFSLGFLVSVIGCNKCVVRIFGDGFL